MIGYLKGTICDIEEKSMLVLVNNIGYTVFLPEKNLSFLKTNMEVEIYTEMIVRENEILLFGFLTKEERNMFRLLNEVTGIGPRSSIGIISFLDINTLSKAIINEDLNVLIKLPGIGKKTAQRIILDLKEKIIKIGNFPTTQADFSSGTIENRDLMGTVFETLEALGYSNREILNVLPELEKHLELSEQELVKMALKLLSEK